MDIEQERIPRNPAAGRIRLVNDGGVFRYRDPNGNEFTPHTDTAAAVEDATDTDDIVDQFNALLTSLRDAGILAE